MSITMTYGTYTFSPVPMINLNRQWRNITEDGFEGNFYHTLTLDGTLTPLPDNAGGILAIDTLQQALMSGLSGCGPLVVSCDGTELLNVYPKIESIQFPPTSNNWVNTSNYTIDMTFEEMDHVDSGRAQYIDNVSESWDFSIQDNPNAYILNLALVPAEDRAAGADYTVETGPTIYSISHTMSVKCSAACRAGGKQAGYLDGFTAIAERFGTDYALWELSHLNASGLTGNPYNHMRSTSIDESAGVFNMTESWIVSDRFVSGIAIEDFNINMAYSIDNPITKVNINGSVQGLENRSWGTTGLFDQTVTTPKYTAALAYWTQITLPRILPRCQLAAEGAAVRSLHHTPLEYSLAYNVTDGIVSYNYSFDDRPIECVAGALSENITVTDTNATDVFAQIIVPGRAAGPVLQNINTTTAASRNVSIEVVVPIGTGCSIADNLIGNAPSAAVTTLLNEFYDNLTGAYGQVFINQDTESWSPKTGRYSREVGWTYQDC